MRAIIHGQKLGGVRIVDDSVVIDAAVDNVSGAVFNMQNMFPTIDQDIPYPERVGVGFRFINPSGNEGYDVDVRVKYSHDGISWADDDQGDSLGNYSDTTVGADLNWSEEVIFIPEHPHIVFMYDNNATTDSVVISSRVSFKWGISVGEGR